MRRWKRQDYVVTFTAVALIFLLFFFLEGCMTPAKKARNLKVLWHDGECVLYLEGLSIEQARGLKEKWEFKDCNVVITENEGGSKK
jgi:hypothetical protein